MNENLLRDHLFLDGYGASQSDAENIPKMCDLLQQVNAEAFRGIGKLRIIPVLGDEKPRNNGLSGIILAPGGHFTCHTFSHRGIYFADLYAPRSHHNDAESLLRKIFDAAYIRQCRADIGPGFGRHVVVKIPPQIPTTACWLIESIVSSIHMTRLCQRMVYSQLDDVDILQPITESHIAIHNAGNQAVLDVFSCKDFSVDELLKALSNFGIEPFEMTSVSRGIELEDKIL